MQNGMWARITYSSFPDKHGDLKYVASSVIVYLINGEWAICLSGDEKPCLTYLLRESYQVKWVKIDDTWENRKEDLSTKLLDLQDDPPQFCGNQD